MANYQLFRIHVGSAEDLPRRFVLPQEKQGTDSETGNWGGGEYGHI